MGSSPHSKRVVRALSYAKALRSAGIAGFGLNEARKCFTAFLIWSGSILIYRYFPLAESLRNCVMKGFVFHKASVEWAKAFESQLMPEKVLGYIPARCTKAQFVKTSGKTPLSDNTDNTPEV